MINKIPDTKISLKPPTTLTRLDSMGNIQNSFENSTNDPLSRSFADWTSNKLKANKLQGMLEKSIHSIEKILEVYQQEFKLVTSSEGKLNKLLG